MTTTTTTKTKPATQAECPHDGTTCHVTEHPQSGDFGDLLEGNAVTICCGSYVTLSEHGYVMCKCCYGEPPIGYEGDDDLDALEATLREADAKGLPAAMLDDFSAQMRAAGL